MDTTLREALEAAQPHGPVPFESAFVRLDGLHVHRFTHEEKKQFWLACAKQDAMTIERQLFGRTAVGADDKPLYQLPRDIGAIAALNAAFVSEFVADSSRLNCLTDLDVAEVRRSFFANRAAVGSTGSPATSAEPTPSGS